MAGSGLVLRGSLLKLAAAALRDFENQGGTIACKGQMVRAADAASEFCLMPAITHQAVAILGAYGLPHPAPVFTTDSSTESLTGFQVTRIDDLQNAPILLPAMNLLLRSQLAFYEGGQLELAHLTATVAFVEFCNTRRQRDEQEISMVYGNANTPESLFHSAAGMLVGSSLLEISGNSNYSLC